MFCSAKRKTCKIASININITKSAVHSNNSMINVGLLFTENPYEMLSLICLFVLLVVHGSTAVINPSSNLKTVNQWNLISYNFPYGMNTNDPEIYNPMNIVATGVAVAYDRLFIATPKLFAGVTSTLSSISKDMAGDSPALEAFPDWSFHKPGRQNASCDELQLISVYRLRIDSCNRLWVLDAGVSRSLEDFEKTCPPKILVFDLNTNQVVRRLVNLFLLFCLNCINFVSIESTFRLKSCEVKLFSLTW